MALKSSSDIMARARIIATQVATDSNLSIIVDNKPAFRALLDTAISQVYTKRASDKKNWRDISTRSTVAITANVGTLPSGVLREFLHQADFANDAGELISYVAYEVDNQELYTQLTYVIVQGDSILYRPADKANAFSGNLYMTAPTIPSIPSDPDTAISLTDKVYNDVCSTLASMIRGDVTIMQ